MRTWVVVTVLGILLAGEFGFGCALANAANPAGTTVDSLWKEPVVGGRRRTSSYNPSGGNFDYHVVEPGQRATLLAHDGDSGSIRRIWFTIVSTSPDYLGTIKMRFTFDNQVTVDDVPVGMLTATGPWRVNDLTSPVLNTMRARQSNRDHEGVGRGSFNILWPMPFAKSAKVELLNSTKDPIKLHFHVDYQLHDVPDRPLLFHAHYNRRHFTKPLAKGQPNDPKTANHLLADIRASEGRYVGTVLAVESHPDRKGKWYEGDETFLVDGRPEATLHGTGTEDYFGMAWGVHRLYQGYDHGVTHYQRNLTDHDRFFDGRFVLYRWHLADPIPFRASLHASLEAGHANECQQHYESTAFWYGRAVKPDATGK
ncbi:MAG: DUF2961 domain-containing protein [Pirellulales bacterium]|nr:DUF2961 domain-containing protein [Pirellulales bacterium]